MTGNTTPAQLEEIMRLLKLNLPREARARCAALCAHSRDAEVWNLLGMIDGGLGALPQAEASFRVALTLQPAHAKALGNLQRLLANQGKPAPKDGFAVREEELRRRLADLLLGPELAARAYGPLQELPHGD